MAKSQSEMERIENVPLTARARTAIMEAILERRFSERLPSEEQLAEMLNVSRTTIRTALQSLEQDGIITRKRAIGTTINAHLRPSSLALQRMVGFGVRLRVQAGADARQQHPGVLPRAVMVLGPAIRDRQGGRGIEREAGRTPKRFRAEPGS